MKRSKAARMVRVDENYIFYTCLFIVLAIAVLGVATDALAGR